WSNSLTDEESQKICMARLFYHRPKFAILDECTSAVSYSVEETVYKHAKSIGITLITISNRNYLAVYHEYVLRLGDSHPPSIPSSGAKRGNKSSKLLGGNLNSSSSNNSLYARRAWSGEKLISVDESEEIIRSNFSEKDPNIQPANNLGVSWYAARLNTAYSGSQNVFFSYNSPIEKRSASHSTRNERTLAVSRNISSSQLSNMLTSKNDRADDDKTEIVRLRRVLFERRQLYQNCQDRLSGINSELEKVVLDQRIIDALE
ncbi:ATP-binding cassette sub-family D member 3, partial [Smittium mucronatum]